MSFRGTNHIAWKLAYSGKWKNWSDRYTSPNAFDHPFEMYAYLSKLPAYQDAIYYLEFGVYQGASLNWWLEHNGHPSSEFVGFDSFRGLPESWTSDFGKGHFDVGGVPPDIGDPRCSFQVGWFNKTLPGFLCEWGARRDGRPVIIHLDGDLYSSTIFVLLLMGPGLRPGDLLILDDFSDTLHVFRALLDFEDACPIEYEVVAQHARYHRVALRVVRRQGEEAAREAA